MSNGYSILPRPVVEDRNLSRNFDQKWALQDVSLQIPQRGPNGCKKNWRSPNCPSAAVNSSQQRLATNFRGHHPLPIETAERPVISG
jgi:hypothetical protein